MRVLVACEESQAVTIELRKLGHEAYSCDIIPCSGGHPEWHLQQDVIPLLNEKWDMIIAFPPCTYLTVTGNRWFNVDRYGEKAIQRHKDRADAINFFLMSLYLLFQRIKIIRGEKRAKRNIQSVAELFDRRDRNFPAPGIEHTVYR